MSRSHNESVYERILGNGAPVKCKTNVHESTERLVLKCNIQFGISHAVFSARTDMWGANRKVYARVCEFLRGTSDREQYELVSAKPLEGWPLKTYASRAELITDCVRRKHKGLLLPYAGDLRNPFAKHSSEYTMEFMHTSGVAGNSFYGEGFKVDASKYSDVTRDPVKRPNLMDCTTGHNSHVLDPLEGRFWFPACTANHNATNPNCAFVSVPIEVFCPHVKGGDGGLGETCDVIHLTLIANVDEHEVLDVNYGDGFHFANPLPRP
jgi:hypothetical protein